MNMRKQFVQTIEMLLENDPRLVLLLGDIGVFGFRKSFQKYPERVYNIGILEQATIGLAAGMSLGGLTPVVYTIAPFLIERSLEQLKMDFCYQGLNGNFVSVGGSYDYAALGCSHHCPGDVGALKNLPGMEIVVPGHPEEFSALFRAAYANGHPTYFRLSERSNGTSQPVRFGSATVCQTGTKATVVAIGPMLAPAWEAAKGLDVTLLYYTTVEPFDAQALRENCPSAKVLLCEPFYTGTLAAEINQALKPRPVRLECVGVPRAFLTNYGTMAEQDEYIGVNANHIRRRLEELSNE